MQKKRIAHIITRMIIGGAQENTLLSVEGLHAREHYDVDLITGPALGPEGSLLDLRKSHPFTIHMINELRRNLNPFFDFIALFKLYRLFKKYRYAVVHTHSSKAGILGRFAARLAGVRLIVHTIHGLPFHEHEHPVLNFVYIMLERWVSRFTHTIVTVAPEMKRKALAVKVGVERQYRVVYSGINVDNFLSITAEESRQLRQRLNIPEHACVVGKIARLFYLKGYEYLLPVAEQVLKKHPDVYFLLVGDGILRNPLEQEARRLGIDERVIFVGLVSPEKVPLFISIMDIVVHLSLREGLPRVVPQAFLLEKPVVVFDCDGAKDIVDDEDNGYLVPPKDSVVCAQKVNALIVNKQIRSRMGQEGKKKALRLFPAEVMVDSLETIYRDALGKL